MNSSPEWVYVDGSEQAAVSATDRGLAYGHGLFETMAVVNGQVILAQSHAERLKLGCSRLNIHFSAEMEHLLWSELKMLSARLYSGTLKLIVTAGSAGRGYAAPRPEPRRIFLGYQSTEYPQSYREDGVAIRTCFYRLPVNEQLAGIKHLNRLDQVMARREWMTADWTEGVMLDSKGVVVEGIMTNLFAVIGGDLVTPLVDRAGVAGVMRCYLLEQAEAIGLSVDQVRLPLEQFFEASEVFICNSVIGIWPVRQWDQSMFKLGPVTCRLLDITDQLFKVKMV